MIKNIIVTNPSKTDTKQKEQLQQKVYVTITWYYATILLNLAKKPTYKDLQVPPIFCQIIFQEWFLGSIMFRAKLMYAKYFMFLCN